MRFKDSEKLKIKSAAFELSKASTDCKKLTGELRDKIGAFVERIFDVSESETITWIDQVGAVGQRVMHASSLERLLKGARDTLGWVSCSKIWENDSLGTSLELALLLRETVDGIGATRASQFKALFDGCSSEDSVSIHIMENVFYAGKHAKGAAPWEQTEGHTVWTPTQVLETIMHVYGYDLQKSKELSKFLLSTGLVGNYDGLLSLPAIHHIESELMQLAESKFTPMPMNLNRQGLTTEQSDLLTEVIMSDAKVVAIRGPGGTGKTHTTSRLIQALIDDGKSVLCCAPTGISAKVLNDALVSAEVDTGSLSCHGVVVLDRAIALARFGQIDADYLIIDEASMVSVNHLSLIGLLFGLERLIMLGDPNQLRPVEAGQPFKDLIANPNVKTVSLYTNMRANSQKLADELSKVRAGLGVIHRTIPMAKSPLVRDHGEIRANVGSVPLEFKRQLGRWITASVEQGYIWLAHTNNLVRALSNYNLAVKHGFSETTLDLYLDDIVAAYFGAKSHKMQSNVSMGIDGLEVYWTADRHGDDVRVYRGFAGVVNGGHVRMNAITADGVGQKVDFALEEVEYKIMPWMVKTVHKSQGQTLDNVAYLIKSIAGKHNLELTYTAQSRAKKDAMVISLCTESKTPNLVADSDRITSMRVK
jgi:hypothetical protein